MDCIKCGTQVPRDDFDYLNVLIKRAKRFYLSYGCDICGSIFKYEGNGHLNDETFNSILDDQSQPGLSSIKEQGGFVERTDLL